MFISGRMHIVKILMLEEFFMNFLFIHLGEKRGGGGGVH